MPSEELFYKAYAVKRLPVHHRSQIIGRRANRAGLLI